MTIHSQSRHITNSKQINYRTPLILSDPKHGQDNEKTRKFQSPHDIIVMMRRHP